MLKTSTLDREQVIIRLANCLDDSFLTTIFPGLSPADVRKVLRNEETTKTTAPKQVQTEHSTKPLHSIQCSLYTDGASRGNPGDAGAGAVVFDEQGEEIGTCSEYLGTCTNNVAEYKALIIGLEKAISLSCKKLSIYLDSELIVKQIKGQYKVKNETLKPLFLQVKSLLAKLPSWSVNHVPRAQNARADELANIGIDTEKSK